MGATVILWTNALYERMLTVAPSNFNFISRPQRGRLPDWEAGRILSTSQCRFTYYYGAKHSKYDVYILSATSEFFLGELM